MLDESVDVLTLTIPISPEVTPFAAHAFTKKYLDIEMLPNGYDFQYLINKGEITEAYLRELEASYQAIS